MFDTGKALRLRRIINPQTKGSVMFACSHGTSTPYILDGLQDVRPAVKAASDGGANVFFLSLGMVGKCQETLAANNNAALALKVSATPGNYEVPFQEVQIAAVDTALALGADAVVAMLALTANNEKENIAWAAKLGEACFKAGMPFIAEAEFPNAYSLSVTEYTKSLDKNYLKRTARMLVELGADVIKTNWTGSIEDFKEVVDCISGTPIVVAGGSKVGDLDLLQRIWDAKQAGAMGCSVGRNIFQHKDPVGITRALCAIVHEGKTPEEALKEVRA